MKETETHKVEASEARLRWGELLAKVSREEARVVVEEGGVPVAALISAEDLERYESLEKQRQERFKALEDSWEAFADVPPEEIEREVARAIEQVRAENRDRERRSDAGR